MQKSRVLDVLDLTKRPFRRRFGQKSNENSIEQIYKIVKRYYNIQVFYPEGCSIKNLTKRAQQCPYFMKLSAQTKAGEESDFDD